jgi:hypothetical protein
VVQLFPHPILGVILLFEALVLMAFVRDVTTSRADTTIACLVGVLALGLPHGFVIGIVIGTALYYVSRRLSILGGPGE